MRNGQLPFTPKTQPRFDGEAFDAKRDAVRLTAQIERIYALMKDGQWRTVQEISAATGDPETSVSAQLRNLRKPRFGSVVVEKRTRVDGVALWEYRVSS